MKNLVVLAVALFVLPVASVSADLVTNGDFASATPGGNDNHVLFDDLDNGWMVKGNPAGWDLTGGSAEYTGTGANKSGLGQASSITIETGSDYTLSFDWTPVAGALDLNYTVAAWKAGTAPAADNRFFTGLNFISQQSRVIGTGGSWTDLNDGSSHTTNANAALNTYTGTAGVATTGTLALNFGGDSIEDFDYIGVKFWSGDATVAGGVLNNVAIVTAVPEPSSLAVIGFCGLGLLIRRRK
ncbi:hypothetical protein CA13_28660 [Planctomycetes bacterium CA13]|uniref:Ice-binding protein C-terminal domain-containing protein n=1 Tax=Novipirellula herctigrandis TaxID=2527986 RepID=A0A5C5Z4E0_9BACT|nr:hypothetical protein CA13_28660 [Planctomycetes bacterium CA13]